MRVHIEMTYITKHGAKTHFISDEMSVGEALVIAEDLENTGRIKQLTFIDNQEGTWTLKQLKRYHTEIRTEPHHIRIFFDGGFDRETRMAGLGCAIYYEQNEKERRIRKNALVEGLVNNNEAEYAALHLGLKELELLGVKNIAVSFIGDSKVVINQLNDEWACYEQELIRWMARIEEKAEQLGIIPTYEEVSRKMNREADQLATQALKGIEISSDS